jgi:uncharacterized protein
MQRSCAAGLLLAPVLLIFSCLPAAAAGSSSLVISQVYGGGGNSGALYTNDFIEIFNLGTSTVNLNGWSVQYASATGSSWQVTNLQGTLAPGQYYLVQESAGTGGSQSLPAADTTGTINMSATAGKVALVNSQTPLSGSCPTGFIDFVGFGNTANCSETAPTVTLSNTNAAIRASGGCTDTDNNSTDFSSINPPTPRNTASPENNCNASQTLTITTISLPSATQNVAYSTTVTASGAIGNLLWSATGLPPGLSIDPATGIISGIPTTASGSPYLVTISVMDSTSVASKSFSLVVNTPPSCSNAIPIGQIQGTGDVSPLVGQQVTTSGIVTALRSNGYYVQSPAPGDGNSATSDGIYVFTSSAPSGSAVVGNLVCVTGTVAEFQGQTEISGPTTTALASNQALPSPIVLTSADLNPNSPLDSLEKYSGMRVTVPSLTVTGPTDGTLNESTATSTSNGEFFGVLTGTPRPFREPGIALTDTLPAGTPPNVPRWDTNPEVLTIYGLGQTGATPLDVTAGAVVTGLTGVLGYYPSAYELYPDPSSTPGISGNITYTAVPDKASNQITVASTNLERFYNTAQDPNGPGTVVPLTPQAFANRLNKVSLGYRNVLKLPDIIAVEEMQDLNTLQTLAAKVNSDAVSAGGPNPNYTAYLAEGNDISNINVGFLVKSTITVVDVTQYGKSTTLVNPTTGTTSLLNDRPPLVLRARASLPGSNQSVPLTIIVNHLRSLTSLDDPSQGPFVRAKRQQQAEFLADLIQSRQAADPNEKIIALGDFNAYQFNDGYVDVVGTVKGNPAPADQVVLSSNALVNPTLTALVDLDAPADRYSYTFSGSAQEIDQILVNQPALALVGGYAVGRLDADFPEVYRNDPNRPERVSDHDWPVVYLNLPAPAPANARDITSQVSISSTGFAYSRISKQYTATLTVTNVSGSALNGPLQLVLSNLNAGSTLANATGTSANGAYITALPSGTLAPGASLTVTVRVTAPQSVSPTFNPLLFSGNF